MKTKSRTCEPHWALLCLLITIVSFALNWQFTTVRDLSHSPMLWDAKAIIQNYHDEPAFLGGLRWWFGAWIHPLMPNYRPIASHFHWAQCWAAERYGWGAVAWSSWLVFAGCCCLLGAIASRWLNSWRAGLIAGFVAAGVRFYNPETQANFLADFPLDDFLLSMAGMLGGMLLFDVWAERGGRWRLVAAWACFLFGCFSKELGYIFAPLILAMAIWRRYEGQPQRGPHPALLIQSVALALTTLVLRQLRYYFVPNALTPDFPWWKVLRAITTRNAFVLELQIQQWAVFILAAAIVVWMAYTRYRTAANALRYALAATGALLILSVFVAPELIFTPLENPAVLTALLLRAVQVLALPLGTYLVFARRDGLGILSLAIYALLCIPLMARIWATMVPWYREVPYMWLGFHAAVLCGPLLELLRLPEVPALPHPSLTVPKLLPEPGLVSVES